MVTKQDLFLNFCLTLQTRNNILYTLFIYGHTKHHKATRKCHA